MKVLITESIDPEGVRILRERGLEVSERKGLADPELVRQIGGFDALIVRSSTAVSAEVLEASTLKVVGRAGVGVNNIDVAAATRLGIAVMNTPTGNITSAVEHTMALLLSLARNVPAADRSMKEGKWEKSAFTGVELSGKTIGVIGLGRIGSRVATRCRAFGMEVAGFDPYLSPKKAEELGVRLYGELDQLLPLADFLTLHVPLGDATRRLLDPRRIALMKRGVRIVNCSRGGVVDEAALLAALESGHVAGAALDVFEVEPPRDLALVRRPGVVATPHLGASTVEAQRNVGLSIAQQVAEALCEGVYREAINLPVENWTTFDKVRPVLALAERLGAFAGQYVEGGLDSVEVEFAGAEFEEKRSIVAAALKGILERYRSEPVNYINAGVLAEERGLSVGQRVAPANGLYRRMLRLALTTSGGGEPPSRPSDPASRTFSFGGALFHDTVPRIVEVDGYELEIRPEGAVLIFENFDRPGVIGAVGTLLGGHGTNIAHFTLGRSAPGGMALAAMNLDTPADPEILGRLRALENMHWVRQVVLENPRPAARGAGTR